MPIMHLALKILYTFENSVDPDQLASDEDPHCFFIHIINQNHHWTDMKLEFHKAYTTYIVPNVCLYQHKLFFRLYMPLYGTTPFLYDQEIVQSHITTPTEK